MSLAFVLSAPSSHGGALKGKDILTCQGTIPTLLSMKPQAPVGNPYVLPVTTSQLE